MAWAKVFGCGLEVGGATRAAWASAGVVAVERRWIFSVTLRPRSFKFSRMLL